MGEDKVKFRGIKTTQIAKHESKAKTVINRYGQKSLSLPRIDDKKRWAGFAGNSWVRSGVWRTSLEARYTTTDRESAGAENSVR